ncbi:hypothetical protein [Microbacterium sp. R86528]|uniref:hypothetical protein n=1 Tax=Microbacterium sp. R86528 TaxID=3093864 RepID=UPI0037C6780E
MSDNGRFEAAESQPPAADAAGAGSGVGAVPSDVAGSQSLAAHLEAPSPDVAEAGAASSMPGAHRGGFSRLPTAPTDIQSQTAPAEPGTETNPVPFAQWVMPPPAEPYRGLAAWALAFSIMGLIVSMFVGWGFPIGVVGIVSAIMALFRPLEPRAVAIWALALGILSVLYSVGWLIFAAYVANIWG